MMFKKLHLKIVFLFFSIFLIQNVNSDESKNQPNSLTKQYRDWVYRCVNVNKKNQCEILQTLTINNTNIQFSFAFSNFINDENELKEVLNIITPLGINVQKKVELKFHKGTVVNLPITRCEVFGCVISLSNNSPDNAIVSLFNQIKDSMNKSIYFELTIDAFQKEPIVIKSSLQGFNNAYKELSKSRS